MRSKRLVKAAVVQTLAALGDVEANIATVHSYVEQAAAENADLIVFPECMNSGYLFDDERQCRKIAEDVDGKFVTALRTFATENGLHVVSGMTELDNTDGCLYNSAVMVDPAGKLVGHYRKQFLATHDYNWFAVGNRGCVVVDTELGRIGLLICFDGRIPEIARVLALSGAEMVVDVANFFEMDQANQWVPARAYENGVWFIASTKSGVERSIYYPGGSQIVGPDGVVRASVPRDTHGMVVADVDPSLAQDKSWFGGDRFADRRAQHYALLRQPFDEAPVAEYVSRPLVPEQSTVKAAAIQTHSLGSEQSLDDAVAMVDDAAKLGVKLLVLPQHFAVGTWCPTVEEAEAAQESQQRAWESVASICRLYGAVAVFPLTYPCGTGVGQATSIIGDVGEELARLGQVHQEPFSGQDVGIDGFSVVDTPAARLGVLLGYDGMFPESSRVLAMAGADVIAWPCAWQSPLQRRLLTVTKAEDNRCFVIAANRTDAPYPGGSIIVNPQGLPHWDVDVAVPPVTRHGAVLPAFLNLALSRQKSIIPKVDVLRSRLVETYGPLAQDAVLTP